MAEISQSSSSWTTLLGELHDRIARRFVRPEPRRRAFSYLKAIISTSERRNGWRIAEAVGEASPDGVQRLLGAASWDARKVRNDLRDYVVEHLGDHRSGVLIVDETGFLKKGEKSVEGALRDSGLEPESLTLEITETVLVENAERRIDTLQKLRDLGVHLAIDDFGTGYSSLAYLKRLPANMLKVTGPFVEGIDTDSEDKLLLSGIISIAQSLGLSVTAEGVETAQQMARLRELGCNLAQGHYFSKALSDEKAAQYLEENIQR